MMNDSLSRFEAQIQRLVEGSFNQIFSGRLHPREVAIALAQAMQDYTQLDEYGKRMAPDTYTVRLNTQDYAAIMAIRPDLDKELAMELVTMAKAVGFTMSTLPIVRIMPDDSLRSGGVTASARHSEGAQDVTGTMDLPARERPAPPDLPESYLVLKGERQVQIDKPLFNIGRHRDNHLILDDSRVSRHHAQIRLRYGRFVLFDTGSTGGTSINGQQVKEAVLRSGDVIELAGYRMLYVGDDEPGRQRAETKTHDTP